MVYKDMREQVLENLKKYDIEALVIIGGDGSLNIGAKLARECDVKVVGVPKTIDNDLPCTERTFGFDTAMAMATEALDRLHTTAESHHRVMVLEVMGRYAGWIALHSGIAGGADVILLPEIPYHLEPVIKKFSNVRMQAKTLALSSLPKVLSRKAAKCLWHALLKAALSRFVWAVLAKKVANEIEERTGIESRCTVLGYLQRGGSPTAFDRVLSTRYGVAAARSLSARRI